MIFKLHKDVILFPEAELAEEDGLLAIGGDLSPEWLTLAYSQGIFPWYSDKSPILWYSPHERFVLFPDKIRISKSMSQIINSGIFRITYDQNFESIIKACAHIERKDQPGTWINQDMQKAYIRLHLSGLAHSVEVWQDQELVGGLYGVSVNNVFCGESMFTKVSNASKAALIWLCRNKNYKMIDCQIESEHLTRMGAEMITRKEYLEALK
ncbi:MAG TPA: leucyl/phenylalanyl-tRNA--protein transferase [Sphingobacteriaceae bacterium]|nr:leucyl/phenylalanyl-tRNA--protein transferase [Sphingobacteriaceae bacterium]